MAQQYNLKNIRSLLTEGFSEDVLRRFCYDEFNFRPVYDQLGQEMGKDKVIDRLIEHAGRTLQFETLLAWAKETNTARYEAHQPYYEEFVTSPIPPKEPQRILPPSPLIQQRVQIYIRGEFSSFSTERQDAVIVKLAALLGIPVEAIELYRVYAGSIVFELGIPPEAVQNLRKLLQTNRAQLYLLKVEKVTLEKESGEFEEWVVKERGFILATLAYLGKSNDLTWWQRIMAMVPEMLGAPMWQGIGAMVAILACIVTLLTNLSIQGSIWPATPTPTSILISVSSLTPTPSPLPTDTPVPTPTPLPTHTVIPTDTPTLTLTPSPMAQTLIITIANEKFKDYVVSSMITMTASSSPLDLISVKGDTPVTVTIQAIDQYANVISPNVLKYQWELCCKDSRNNPNDIQTPVWRFQPPTYLLTETLTIKVSNEIDHGIIATIPFTITVR